MAQEKKVEENKQTKTTRMRNEGKKKVTEKRDYIKEGNLQEERGTLTEEKARKTHKKGKRGEEPKKWERNTGRKRQRKRENKMHKQMDW